jgi:hypothetical protein
VAEDLRDVDEAIEAAVAKQVEEARRRAEEETLKAAHVKKGEQLLVASAAALDKVLNPKP